MKLDIRTFLADISAKNGGGGQNPCPIRKCKFLSENIQNAWDVMKHKNMQYVTCKNC